MVLEEKTNFFLGKTKKTKKNIFWETIRQNSKKIVFLVFPSKKLVFPPKTQLFPRKKMVLEQKTNFFLGKRWFWSKKPTFS